MTYFSGEAIRIRVKNSGLDGLYNLLRGVAHGTEVWPQTCYITVADPRDLSPLRNLLYSILNELSIKQDFTIRMIGDTLILDQKASVKPAAFGVRFGEAPHTSGPGYTTPQSMEVLGPEFDLDDPELFPTKDDRQAIVIPASEDGAAALEYSLDDRTDPDPLVAQFLGVVDMGKNSPIFKAFHRHRLVAESPETYEPDRNVAASKMAAEKRNMEKAIRAAGLLAAPLSEEED